MRRRVFLTEVQAAVGAATSASGSYRTAAQNTNPARGTRYQPRQP